MSQHVSGAELVVGAILKAGNRCATESERHEVGRKLIEWAERNQAKGSDVDLAGSAAQLLVDLSGSHSENDASKPKPT